MVKAENRKEKEKSAPLKSRREHLSKEAAGIKATHTECKNTLTLPTLQPLSHVYELIDPRHAVHLESATQDAKKGVEEFSRAFSHTPAIHQASILLCTAAAMHV